MGNSSSTSGLGEEEDKNEDAGDSRTLEDLRKECAELGIAIPATCTTQQDFKRLIKTATRKEGRRRSSRRNSSNASSVSHSTAAARPSYWKMATDTYEELVCAIIRPPRAIYDVEESLGRKLFSIGGILHERIDFELVNERGLKLQCSWWRERGFTTTQPCCIYLHGNSSCRAEAVEVVQPLLQSSISVVAFDFSGSGLSEGEYVSLGFYETLDLKCVIAHLRESNRVSTICLWGRSMGAVTALMLAETDPSVSCMICDSPFSSLKSLARELVDTAQLQIPKFAIGLGMRVIRSSVKARAKFDINALEVIQNVDKCFVPCLFACAEGDRFIQPKHAADIHAAYAGDKNIVRFAGDHNSPRPQFFFDSALLFLQSTMLLAVGPSTPSRRGDDLLSDFGIANRYRMPAPMRSRHGWEQEEEDEEEAMLQRALLLSMEKN